MILGFLIAFVGLTTVFIVDETEQVVILQFGKPVRTITSPGFNFKVPFPIQEKIVFDDRCVFSFEDMPPYNKSVVPTGLGMNTLYNEAKRLYIFSDQYRNKMGPIRTEQNLIALLESVDPMEADLITKILTNKFEYEGIDKQLIQDTFPGLIA